MVKPILDFNLDQQFTVCSPRCPNTFSHKLRSKPADIIRADDTFQIYPFIISEPLLALSIMFQNLPESSGLVGQSVSRCSRVYSCKDLVRSDKSDEKSRTVSMLAAIEEARNPL